MAISRKEAERILAEGGSVVLRYNGEDILATRISELPEDFGFGDQISLDSPEHPKNIAVRQKLLSSNLGDENIDALFRQFQEWMAAAGTANLGTGAGSPHNYVGNNISRPPEFDAAASRIGPGVLGAPANAPVELSQDVLGETEDGEPDTEEPEGGVQNPDQVLEDFKFPERDPARFDGLSSTKRKALEAAEAEEDARLLAEHEAQLVANAD